MKLKVRHWIMSVAIALLIISMAVFSAASFSHSGIKTTPSLQHPGNSLVQVSGSSNVTNTNFAQGRITIVPAKSSSASPGQGIFITVSLNTSASMANELKIIGNPASAGYGMHLSPAGITSQFGIPASTYGKIESYFSSYGLKIYPDSTRVAITAEGSPAGT